MDERQLIQLIRSHPNRGITAAMEQYGKAVNTICASILVNAGYGLIDEAVSDTFYKLWQNIDQVQLDASHSLKSYLYTIARTTAIDLYRKVRKRTCEIEYREALDMSRYISIEESQHHQELQDTLHEVVEALEPPDNQVFLYKYFLGIDNKRIAQLLHLEKKTVENILYRDKSKLRKLLQERGIHHYEDTLYH